MSTTGSAADTISLPGSVTLGIASSSQVVTTKSACRPGGMPATPAIKPNRISAATRRATDIAWKFAAVVHRSSKHHNGIAKDVACVRVYEERGGEAAAR